MEEGWVPVGHMKEFFALDPSLLQHFSMNKAHSPDPSLPKAGFMSTERPVISPRMRNTSIVSGDNQEGVVPQAKGKPDTGSYRSTCAGVPTLRRKLLFYQRLSLLVRKGIFSTRKYVRTAFLVITFVQSSHGIKVCSYRARRPQTQTRPRMPANAAFALDCV